MGKEKAMEETLRLALAASLKACAKKKDLHKGTKVHADIRARGLLQTDIVLGNLVINMYAKCGAVAKAQQVLDDEMPVLDVVSWSALISGYAQQGQGSEALLCYQRMQRKGILPNAITYVCVLKACGISKELERGKQIHDEIVSQGLLGRNVVLGTALIDMYAKCGAVSKAKQVLNELAVRNSVSWSALIAGYVNQEKCEEAWNSYERMQNEGLTPNAEKGDEHSVAPPKGAAFDSLLTFYAQTFKLALAVLPRPALC
ncbi:hypothetical protein L7F22_020646 [Adiantum nelumboides]|nr:hypothetical protein [Adiantum nelumboides]